MIPLTSCDIVRPLYRRTCDKLNAILRLVLSDKNSRNLFLFLLLNLLFGVVELLYGLWTNSLGLISDAFHMFFDCTGLFAGLVASVITKWKANVKFPFGYVRVEVLAGLVNGLFLIFVALFIFSEAIMRAIEPPEVEHEKLFAVSFLGLLVNIIGIYAFQHAHTHSFGSPHGHSHDANNHAISTPTAGQSQIMKGILLHIVADILGSISVIISSLLIQHFGWLRADPICSILIAIIIVISVMPLIKESVLILMQRQPTSLDYVLPHCYQKVMQLAGVYSIQEPYFWTLCSNHYVGSLKLEVSSAADPKYIVSHTHMIFSSIGIRQLNIQLDFAAI